MPSPPSVTAVGHICALAVSDGAPELTDGQLLEQFVVGKDGTAFAALVRRHGQMVWGTCRNVLRHQQDCEDAFQATFLVLARQAASVRKAEALPGWLHGVAYRVAMKAKRSAARRRAHERQAQPQTRSVSESAWRDLQAALDEEVQGLPPRLRAPFVLCCLEGKGPEYAAGQLGWKVSTVYTRLSQARQELVRRLALRGVSLSAALCAATLSREAAGAALPAALAKVTVRAVLSDTAGKVASGAVSANVAALAQGVTQTMCKTKGKMAIVLFLMAGLLVAGAGVAGTRLPATPEPARPAGPLSRTAAAGKAHAPKGETAEEVAVSGRALGPDGKPVAGAKIYFRRLWDGPGGVAASGPPQAITEGKGNFRFRIARKMYATENEEGNWLRGAVIGVGKGHGPGMVFVSRAEQLANVTVKLVKDVPIEGRVLSLEGKAIAGARVRVREVFTQAKDVEDLTPWVKALKSRKEADSRDRPGLGVGAAVLGLTEPVVTGANGKFRLEGVGRERLVILRFEGPTIETSDAYAMTHLTEKIGAYHGAKFDYAAAPTRPIVGTVREKETGKAVAGVTILTPIPVALGRRGFPGQDLRHYLRTTTDAKGRYRLVGLASNLGQDHLLFAVPAPGQPYQAPLKLARGDVEVGALKIDFELKRGVVIRGRVTNKETGRPVQARVEYFAAPDNPHVRAEDGITSPISTRTAKDGSFTLIGAPGQGLVAAIASAPEALAHRYLVGAGADKIKITRVGFYYHTQPTWCAPGAFNTLVEINPAKGARSVVCDLALDPGKTVTGTIVGPDGKPVKGASIVQEASPHVPFHIHELPTAQFRLPAIDTKPSWTGARATFVFRHHGRDLAAALAFKGDEAKPVTVRLQKCATLRGRLMGKDGKPRPGVALGGVASGGEAHVLFGGQTDRDGRFRFTGIVPGLKVRISAPIVANVFSEVISGVTLKPGETRDVGDVKAAQEPE
jgi:RNA polymerase sigma factor (sigma-70 family)